MRLVFGLVLIAGLGLAGFAVYMAQNYIGAYQSALEQERAKSTTAVPTRPIYVANRAITQGETINPEDIRLAPWPVELLPEEYFDEKTPFTKEGEQPRVAIRGLDKNEAVTAVKVSEPGGDAGLTSRLDRGQRAFAIKVDVASGVSGFLRPGDRVDVYWTGRVPGNDPNLPQGDVTKLIETAVRLIAIDQMSETENASTTIARTVTVAASPQQVAALAQAQSTGRLSLSLMAANDDTVAEAIEVDQRSLLGIAAKKQETQAQALEVCTIRTRRGAEVVEIPIPCTN
ncbi:Flp pilus assembly protein CpaB [Aestuariicoccus sp. MJ-SS9]|uniref:Flp pilus assembly protein CpaB n=1 Tax=Aestuariicoccus sp. MJ-SS9 TaxID=3079855 RepID=UPI002913FFFE|nr:Flp pilus assembly protein CpaB [Aestuariicoccus sp. MJ-SS9]MDU8910359.1 Flp pilus assembly protein CpaB [Aestuariicoccus sp. MJ-SS9]